MPIFEVEVDATVYLNDIVYIVKARDEADAESIVMEKYGEYTRSLITRRLPDIERGILMEYDPHAGAECEED